MQRLEAAARIIADNRLSGGRLGLLDEAVRPTSEAEAYGVQARVHRHIAPRAGARIGYKIGCTTAVMQAYLGIPNPCFGGVFSGGIHQGGASIEAADYRRIGVECEIAVRLGSGIDTASDITPDTVPDFVEAVHAAIEIVDDRYADWRSTDTPTLIADDFFAAGCVLGPAVRPELVGDLAEATGVTRVNGVIVGTGSGRDVLGHPAIALAWLARTLSANGRRLRPGDIVLTGSLVETRWLDPGDEAMAEISGLGRVSVKVAP